MLSAIAFILAAVIPLIDIEATQAIETTQRLFGSLSTVGAYLFMQEKTPKAVKGVVHPVLSTAGTSHHVTSHHVTSRHMFVVCVG